MIKMMKVSLKIRYDDKDKYLNGEEIMAATEKNDSYIFNSGMQDVELIEVIVPIEEIVSKQSKELKGMVRGTFTYYMIQRKD
jgi:hypothetical protein